MEIKVQKNEFSKNLRWVQGIVEKKSTMPVLANVLLEAEGAALCVTATDLEVSVQVRCAAQVLKNGALLINARSLCDIVREAAEEEIHIKGEEAKGVRVLSGRSEFKVLGLSSSEFPNLPELKNRKLFDISAAELTEMIEKTSYAQSTDETRYILNGVYLERLKGERESTGQTTLRMVATDGHRLSYLDRKVSGEIPLEEGVVIPRKGLGLLKRLAEEVESGISLSFGSKELVVLGKTAEREGVTLFIRLIEGTFPKYGQVIPKKNDRLVSVPRDLLTGALKRASIIAEDRSRAVKLLLSPGHLEISSSNPDLGEVKEELDVDYKGESFQVGFNARYFLDVLNVVKDEKVILELGDELSPCVIRSEYDRDFLSLVMPMRL